jgi:L-asparaginase / beta-aspartyl-peptidase
MGKYSIAVHGGAGTIMRSLMTPEIEAEYRKALDKALKTGVDILKDGGSALDAVCQTLVEFEDSPLFNAGRGSVFNHEGKHEMDASIMDGKSLLAGAIANVHGIKNPVLLARCVMEKSGHVMLAGEGAMEFAWKNGFKLMPDSYFFTEERYEQWQAVKNTDVYVLDNPDPEDLENPTETELGTAGAVALDSQGNLAAATSTGGMTNKQYGRIGDSPIIGAGTYANNNTCAVSCTGHGEFFMMGVVAYDIHCLMDYKGLSLKEACELVIMDKQVKLGGEGGLIAVDKHGNIELVFNSEGMYRGRANSEGLFHTAIFSD